MTVTGSTVNAGTVTFQVDGIGRYDFSKTLTMEITKATPQVTRTGAASYIYDGKAKKTYYVQVRAFKKIGTKTYYGPWGAKKTV